MEKQTYVALNFDYDTKNIGLSLKQMQNMNSYRIAYLKTRKYLEKNGFMHEQESAYLSKEKMYVFNALDMVSKISAEIPYLSGNIKSFNLTVLEDIYDVTHLVRSSERQIVYPQSLQLSSNQQSQAPRSIRFDIEQKKLKEEFRTHKIYRQPSYAYKMLKEHFLSLGYIHSQGNVYIIPEQRNSNDVKSDVMRFSKKHPYIANAFKSVQITNITKEYNATKIANYGIANNPEMDKKMRDTVSSTINPPSLDDVIQKATSDASKYNSSFAIQKQNTFER